MRGGRQKKKAKKKKKKKKKRKENSKEIPKKQRGNSHTDAFPSRLKLALDIQTVPVRILLKGRQVSID